MHFKFTPNFLKGVLPPIKCTRLEFKQNFQMTFSWLIARTWRFKCDGESRHLQNRRQKVFNRGAWHCKNW